MAWYAAHIVSYVKFKDGIQDKYPLWENVVLIEAESGNIAHEEAVRIGMSDYDDTDDPEQESMTWDGRPAYWVFAGIRKLMEVTETARTIDRAEAGNRPIHGTEITYSEMQVDSEEDLLKFVEGNPVTVLYEK